MTTLSSGRGPNPAYTGHAATAGPLGATVLADALWRATVGLPIPPALAGPPLATISAATAREGLEAIIRGPGAVTFRRPAGA